VRNPKRVGLEEELGGKHNGFAPHWHINSYMSPVKQSKEEPFRLLVPQFSHSQLEHSDVVQESHLRAVRADTIYMD
jgi:hypothetical protein